MSTLNAIYKEHFSELEKYYHNKDMAFQIFSFLYEYVFQEKFFLVKNDTVLSKKKVTIFRKYIHDITVFHLPIEYIVKTIPFINISINITPPVLIPRTETEYWINWLTKKLESKKTEKLFIADFCSGSGCIGIALLDFFKKSFCDAFDNMSRAVELASQNATLNQVKKRYTIYLKDIFKIKKQKKYDIIVANPPYISLKNYEKLDLSVKQWEAKSALTDNKHGYAFIIHILLFSKNKLKKDSILAIEICCTYAHFILKYAKKTYNNNNDFVFLVKDQYNKNRVLMIARGSYKAFFECVHEVY